ncbi:LPS export ABC transporter periplasmic protein LptC [Capnocytophaga canimorsus]|uniref:LPS export ABC transporter periplasmic protein LptC n=1 Tax=Capnocytophaga canimorsus TaxID=28188 RepID=A0A250G4R7_9FLAO|nr:LPS export ABC transporter periplasmic protein LptC [Capnocytophaga canimorsus]ATA92201.1 LPS export ABC transporter periplasmic protein LptC [Capnocytophaga canimorsus]
MADKKSAYILKGIAVLLGMAMLFSCTNDFKNIQKQSITHKFPQGQTYDFRLVYTDSARMVAVLTSALNDDFSNQKFPYYEFPKGVRVDFFDENDKKNTIEANYGIVYTKSQMVELRDSVVLTTSDGKKLKTSQLFWDQKLDWIFTEKSFTFTDSVKGTLTRGVGMDFDKKFSTVRAHRTTGVLAIPEQENNANKPRTTQ